MIRSLIVDDEEPARRSMVRLLSNLPDINVIGEAANGIEALQRVKETHPDVIFLDIEMPGLNGFEVLAQLSDPPLTVFATAFDDYAIRAFEANAVDYLLKPIQADRLVQTIDRIRTTLARPRHEYQAALRRAIAMLNPGSPTKLAGRRGNRIVLLAPRDIAYASVEDELVFLHTATDRFRTDRTVAELEELLAPLGFCRLNRSSIVNLKFATELLPWTSGTWKIKLSNGVELDVSRDRARFLRSKIV